MKKLLTLAVSALAGLWALTASATALEDGHYYKLRSVGYPAFYMNIEQAANSNAVLSETASIIYVQKKADDNDRWHLRANSATGALLGASGWNAVCNSNDTDHFFLVVEQTEKSSDNNPIITLYNDWTINPNNTSQNKHGYISFDYSGGNTSKSLFCDKTTLNDNAKWEVIEVPMPHDVTYTVKHNDKTVYTYTVSVEAGEVYSTPTLPTGYTVSDPIVNSKLTENKSVTIAISPDFKPFKLNSLRYIGYWAKYSKDPLNSVENQTEGEWFVQEGSDSSFKIFSVKSNKYMKFAAGTGATREMNAATSSADAGVFTVTRKDNGVELITEGAYGISTNTASEHHLFGYNSVDVGNAWIMVYDETIYAANKSSLTTANLGSHDASTPFGTAFINAQVSYDQAKILWPNADYSTLLKYIEEAKKVRFGLTPNISTLVNNLTTEAAKFAIDDDDKRACAALIVKGNVFRTLNISSEDAISAWDTLTGNLTEYGESVQTQIQAALTNLVTSACTGNIKIRHAGTHNTHYIATDNRICKHTDATGAQAMHLEPATGGFYIKNEYANAYMKLTTTNENCAMMVQKTDASIFEFKLNEDNATVMIHEVGGDNYRNFHANAGTIVMPWEAGANSNWYLEPVSADAAADEYYTGAMHWSENATSNNLTGFYCNDLEAINTARAIAEPTTTAEKRTKGDAINAALAKQKLNLPTSGKLYTITNTDTGNSRGNLQYASEYESIATSGRNGVAYNADDVNQQWAIYTDANDKNYLYNLGAKKFANIYYERPNHNGGATNEDFCWRFSDVPTEITEFVTEGLSFDATNGHGFKIYAAEGKNTTSGAHAGMFVVNGITEAPVPAAAGFGSTDNGIGFWFTEVGTVSEALQSEMQAAFEAYPAAVTAAKTAYTALAPVSANDNVVGHYTTAGANAYTEAGTNATATGATADTQHYYYTKGLNIERVALEHESVYTLTTSENMHYAVIGGKLVYTEEAAKENANTHFWQANVGEGKVSFTHTYNKGENDSETITLTHDGATEFTIEFGEPGVVTFVPVEAEEEQPETLAEKPAMRRATPRDNALTFTITKAPGSSATTAIRELTAEGAAQAIYDLQGRKLSAPVKGINIIGGRKVLVK